LRKQNKNNADSFLPFTKGVKILHQVRTAREKRRRLFLES
jgi:hypothetical protein